MLSFYKDSSHSDEEKVCCITDHCESYAAILGELFTRDTAMTHIKKMIAVSLPENRLICACATIKKYWFTFGDSYDNFTSTNIEIKPEAERNGAR